MQNWVEELDKLQKDWQLDKVYESGLNREYYYHAKEGDNNMSAKIITAPHMLVICGDYGEPFVFRSDYCGHEDIIKVLAQGNIEYNLKKMAWETNNYVEKLISVQEIRRGFDSYVEEMLKNVEDDEEREAISEHSDIKAFRCCLLEMEDYETYDSFYDAIEKYTLPINTEYKMYDELADISAKEFIWSDGMFSEGLPDVFNFRFYYAIQVLKKVVRIITFMDKVERIRVFNTFDKMADDPVFTSNEIFKKSLEWVSGYKGLFEALGIEDGNEFIKLVADVFNTEEEPEKELNKIVSLVMYDKTEMTWREWEKIQEKPLFKFLKKKWDEIVSKK